MEYINKIQENTFAAACYNDNSIEELVAALAMDEADAADCATWGITAAEWRAQIALALNAKIDDTQAPE